MKLLGDVAFGQRGMSRLTATTRISRPGSSLAHKIGAIEVGRSDKEIAYEWTSAAWSGM
jgi:hypothetical protein